ncbi:MAG: ABC transporter permease [Ornithinimicrobium sp.]
MPSLVLFVGRRLLRGVITLWFAVTVTFLLLRLLPGDPVTALASTNMDEATRLDLLQRYGLSDSLPTQYGKYLVQLAQGDLGISFTQRVPVTEVLMARLPWTLLLTLTALAVTVAIGVPLGVLAATRARTIVDRAVQVGGVVGQSLFVPSIGILLLYVLGLQLGWLPIGGAYNEQTYGLAWYGSVAAHLILPCASLVLVSLGSYVLTMRATLIDSLGEDYCDLARAKGLPARTVVWKHALRNALLPTTTLLGLQLGFLVGGAVLTETVFAYPGVGRAIYDSVNRLDFPVLQGAFIMLAATVVLANLVTDLAYGMLDPRVRSS